MAPATLNEHITQGQLLLPLPQHRDCILLFTGLWKWMGNYYNYCQETMSCRRTVKLHSNPDLLFSKYQIVIKRTNAQITGMEYYKWDLQMEWKPEMQVLYKPKRNSRR